MGNILRRFKADDDADGDHYPSYTPASRPHYQPQGQPHGVTLAANADVAALAQDLLNFEATSVVPEGLGEHVASLPAESSMPDGVQFMLNTLPVNAKCVGDGDGFTAYVDTADPRESASVPLKVHEAVIARAQARSTRNYQRADALQRSVSQAGYWIVDGEDDEEILAKKYRIRMRGIDAPEMEMPYGKESKNALIKLIAGKCVTIYVYEQDQYERYVSDVYCNGAFIQEQILKKGFAMHFKKYDKRQKFAQWEREAKAARRGLWASENPKKPWDWRREQRNAGFRCTDHRS